MLLKFYYVYMKKEKIETIESYIPPLADCLIWIRLKYLCDEM
jgi:hypothetical protein